MPPPRLFERVSLPTTSSLGSPHPRPQAPWVTPYAAALASGPRASAGLGDAFVGIGRWHFSGQTRSVAARGPIRSQNVGGTSGPTHPVHSVQPETTPHWAGAKPQPAPGGDAQVLGGSHGKGQARSRNKAAPHTRPLQASCISSPSPAPARHPWWWRTCCPTTPTPSE